jgi:hypothetical protein
MRRRLAAAMVSMLLAIVTGAAHLILPVSAQSEPVTIELAERNDSGVSGEAGLVAADGATWVHISVDGASDNYLPYLHRGTCSAYFDAPAIPLALTATGVQSKTAVDLPLDELESGSYVIDLHIVVGDLEDLLDPKSSVACGAIGAEEGGVGGSTATTQPPVTGIGPLQTGRDWTLAVAFAMAILSFVLALTCLRERRLPAEPPVIINVVAMHRLRGLTQ